MKKILVIEDDQSLKELLIDILENEGYQVFYAHNGKSGIQLAKEIIPDLIICDIMMPGIDGYSVKTSLSDDMSTALIPFIYLSALAEKKDIRHGMELGADDYITKPFKIDEITNAVKTRFKKQELLAETRNKNSIARDEKNELQKISDTGHVIVEVNKQPRLIKVNSISCITAFSEYTYVYLGESEKIIIRRLLKKWEEILPESIFIRIHRSTIINLNHIVKVEKWFNNSFAIFINGFQESFIVSRRYSVQLKNRLHYK